MAETRVGIIIEGQDKFSNVLNKVEGSLGGFRGKVESMSPMFSKMALAGTAAFGAITAGVYKSVQAANEAEVVQERLAHILRTTVDATDEQIKALSDQADALEKVGVVSADVIRQGQGQLASFDLQTDSIRRLIPSILDYAVAEKGLTMTTSDLQSMTNGLAQALQGNFGALTKTGFVLDDATKELISNGTETERVTALVEVLGSTYEGMNEKMRQTTAGGIVGMNFQMDKLKETIGSALVPVINDLTARLTPVLEKMASWAERNPDLTAKIVAWGLGVSGVIAALGGLGLVLPSVIRGIELMGTVIKYVRTIEMVGLLASIDKIKAAFLLLQATAITAWKGIATAITTSMTLANAQLLVVLGTIYLLIEAFRQFKALQGEKQAAKDSAQKAIEENEKLLPLIENATGERKEQLQRQYNDTLRDVLPIAVTGYAGKDKPIPVEEKTAEPVVNNYNFTGDVYSADELMRKLNQFNSNLYNRNEVMP